LTLLDAYAVVALLVAEPAGAEVKELLRAGGCRVVVVNLAEAIDVSTRVHGLAQAEVRRLLEPLIIGGALGTVRSDVGDAWAAAELRARHYRRRERALSTADCFLLAHAIDLDDRIATADAPVADVARAEGVGVVSLPDTTGVRP